MLGQHEAPHREQVEQVRAGDAARHREGAGERPGGLVPSLRQARDGAEIRLEPPGGERLLVLQDADAMQRGPVRSEPALAGHGRALLSRETREGREDFSWLVERRRRNGPGQLRVVAQRSEQEADHEAERDRLHGEPRCSPG